MVQADARAALVALADALAGWAVDAGLPRGGDAAGARLGRVVGSAYTLGHGPLPAQSEVIGAVNDAAGPRDVVVCAAGSLPGDLHRLWRTRDPKGYHVEYGYSCMGYEIAGGLGVRMAAPDRERVRHGRRRLLPDDRPGAGDRGPGADPADRRAHPEPRLPVDRGAVRIGRSPALRHALPLSRRFGPPRRGNAAGRPGRQRGQPRRPRRSASRESTSYARRWPTRRPKRIRGPWSSTWRPTRWCRLRTAAAGGMSPLPSRRTSSRSRRRCPTTRRQSGASGRTCRHRPGC